MLQTLPFLSLGALLQLSMKFMLSELIWRIIDTKTMEKEAKNVIFLPATRKVHRPIKTYSFASPHDFCTTNDWLAIMKGRKNLKEIISDSIHFIKSYAQDIQYSTHFEHTLHELRSVVIVPTAPADTKTECLWNFKFIRAWIGNNKNKREWADINTWHIIIIDIPARLHIHTICVWHNKCAEEERMICRWSGRMKSEQKITYNENRWVKSQMFSFSS